MRTTVARDAVEMDAKLATGHFDLLVLDVMMPGEDGLSVCRRLAPEGDLPIIMLTALGEETDRIVGLEIGADDYLAKPFAPEELVARVEALGRRQASGEPPVTVLRVGDLEMDLLSRKVTRGETKIDLQPREFKLLEYLMRHAGQTVTRTMLLEKVWNYHFDPQTNVIDVHISRLRAKIDKEFEHQLLQTVRGAGYCLQA